MGGNVGIGTTTPSVKLDVSGSTRIYDQTPTTGVSTLTIRAGAGQATSPLFTWQNNAGTGLGVIDSSGNVGIGTTSPGEKLTIAAGNISLTTANSYITGATGLTLQETGDTYGTVKLNLQNRTGVNGAMFEQAGSVDLVDFVFKGLSNQRNIRYENRNVGAYQLAQPEFEIGTAADPTMDIADTGVAIRKGGLSIGSTIVAPPSNGLYASGNVGIGTTTTGTYKVNVNGSVNATSYYVGGSALGTVASGSVTGQTLYWNGSAWTANTNIFVDGANVGIGITTTASKLAIYSGDDKDTGPIINLGGNAVNQVESGRIRFTETSMAVTPWYQGAFIQYNGSTNTLNIGTHGAASALQADDYNEISIARGAGTTINGPYASAPGLTINQEWNTTVNEALRLQVKANPGIDRGVEQTFYIPTTGATSRYGADITVANQFASGNGAYMKFSTENTGGSAVEAVRIDSSGNVGIGTTTPGSKFTLSRRGARRGNQLCNVRCRRRQYHRERECGDRNDYHWNIQLERRWLRQRNFLLYRRLSYGISHGWLRHRTNPLLERICLDCEY